jgi:hypothetical protein
LQASTNQRSRRHIFAASAARTIAERARILRATAFWLCACSQSARQSQDPEPRNPIRRVLAPSKETDHVLDVRGFEKLEAAYFTNGMLRPDELNLELGAVVGGAEQHRLRFQQRACFPGLEDLLSHVPSLSGLIGYRSQEQLLFRFSFRPQVLGEPLGRNADHAVAGINQSAQPAFSQKNIESTYPCCSDFAAGAQ